MMKMYNDYALNIIKSGMNDRIVNNLNMLREFSQCSKDFLLFGKISEEEWTKSFDSWELESKQYVNIKLPKRSTRGSGGYDIFSNENVLLPPNASYVFNTGINVFMSENLVLLIAPRSGLGFKYQCSLANTIGVIDADYFFSDNEGHIKVKIVNRGDKEFEIKKGDAFCQAICVPYIIAADDNADGIRNGGFGSTSEKVEK